MAVTGGNLGWGALVAAWLLACGARAIGEPANTSADKAAAPSAGAAHQAASLPPGYGAPQPPPETCAGCRPTRVVIESEAGTDIVSLCAVRPSSPIKPFDAKGTLLRSSVKACEPECCPRADSP